MNLKQITLLTSTALVLTLTACSKGERPKKVAAPAASEVATSEATASSAPITLPASEPVAILLVDEIKEVEVASAPQAPAIAPPQEVQPAPVLSEQITQPVVKETIVPAASAPAVTAHGSEQACQPVTDREIAALFDRWNASLQTGDKAAVVANYASDSILLPTVSDKIRYSRAEKEDYFAHFLEKSPVGSIKERYIQVGCNSAIDAGLYEFAYQKTGERVLARYSFTYSWDGKQWLITSHHSSGMPEQAQKASAPVTH